MLVDQPAGSGILPGNPACIRSQRWERRLRDAVSRRGRCVLLVDVLCRDESGNASQGIVLVYGSTR